MYALIKENKNGLTKVIAKSESLEKIFNKIDDLKLDDIEGYNFDIHTKKFSSLEKLLNKKELYFFGYLKKFIFRVYFIKKY